MFPGRVHRGKVYWWWGQILEDGTCIDGVDVISPGEPGYAEKRDAAWNRAGLYGLEQAEAIHRSLGMRRRMDQALGSQGLTWNHSERRSLDRAQITHGRRHGLQPQWLDAVVLSLRPPRCPLTDYNP